MKHRADRPTDSDSLADRDGRRALPMSDCGVIHAMAGRLDLSGRAAAAALAVTTLTDGAA